MAARQQQPEQAFVLHRYDWSETSLILEAFVRGRGKVALVAKGAKRPSSQLRAVLLPLQPIRVNFTRQKNPESLLNLRSAEWIGGHVMPTGAALLAGYQLNELLMRLLARDDPHPMLFDLYASAVAMLASPECTNQQAVLRAFELHLLKQIGWLPDLNLQTTNLQPLVPHAYYVLTADQGLRPVFEDESVHTLTGQQWLQLHQALEASSFISWQLTWQYCIEVVDLLHAQLRSLLLHHSGVRSLRTRELINDLRSLLVA